MIAHRFVESVLCTLLVGLVAATTVDAASSDRVLVDGRGTWTVGRQSGEWNGQFVISFATSAMSGHMNLAGLGEIGSVNVAGSGAGTSFSLETAADDTETGDAQVDIAGEASWDSISGTLSLPTGGTGTWTGHLSLAKSARARVSQKVRDALRAGTAQNVLIEFDRDLALQNVPGTEPQRRPSKKDRPAVLQARAGAFATMKDRVLAALPTGDVAVKRQYRNLPTVFASLKNSDALDRLIANPEVVSVSEDVARHPDSISQSRQLVKANQTYSLGWRGQGTAVAVIDSGVDWTADSTIFGTCPQGAGGTDCHVIVAMDTAPNDGVRDAGWDTTERHGTDVARLVIYTAPATNILAYDAVDESINSTLDSTVFAAIDDIITRSATINIVAVNLSFGGSLRYSDQESCSTDTIENGAGYAAKFKALVDVGVLPVVSSGNDGAPGILIPACVRHAISVGSVYDGSYGSLFYYTSGGFFICSDATTSADQVVCSSNAASFLSILAPGARLEGVDGQLISGTSFAAPFVAGAIAVVQGNNVNPNDSPECTRLRLIKTGDPIVDSRSGTPITFPRLNVLAAASSAKSVGDCDGNGTVGVNELITGTRILLGMTNLSQCPSFDVDGSTTVDVNELVKGVNFLLSGNCPM